MTTVDYTIINLEAGMPTVAVARKRLEQALRTAKARRTGVLKIIHGYGSSGRGGAIKRDVQAVLAGSKRSGQITAFVPGEDFSPFHADARRMIDKYPGLARDRDFTRSNNGITMVLL